MLQDVRYAFRQLRKSPGFALTVVLTLALGIGVNTAIFSVMNAVLLRSLPVRDPQQLVYLTHEHMPPGVGNTGDSRYTYGMNVYNRLREDRAAFADVIAYVPLSFTKTAARYGDTPEDIEADEVSGNFFSALGVEMTAGQAFAAADEDKHSQLAVLSYGYWTRRFNRDPQVIGRILYINGVPFTVTGIASPRFYGVESGGNSTDVWVPLQNRPELPSWGTPFTSGRTLYGSPNWWNLMLMARLRPGVTPKQAQAHMNPVFAHAAYETVGKDVKPNGEKLELQLAPAQGLGTANTDYETPLHVLMGMVALVLVIACVNIIMLFVARNSAREREFSLRLALGANRWPLFRQLLAESAILVTSGSLLGWLFAVEATRLLALWSALEISLAPDTSVLLFTLGISVIAAVLFGLAPLRSASNTPVTLVLRSTGTQATTSRSRVVTGKILIAMQMALCVMLLFASGLLVRTLRNYQNVDLGMHADSVLAFGVHPIGAHDDAQKLAFYSQLSRRIQLLPGVESVTLAGNRPGSGWTDNNLLTLDGREYPWDDGKNMLRSNEVGSDFFRTLGIPVMSGRDIRESDTKGAQRVVVINQTLADRFLKHTSPIGHTIGGAKNPATIVGVVRDSKYNSSDEEPMPMAWYSYQQSDSIGNMDVEVRAAGNPVTLLPAIRRVLREMDPNAPLDKPEVLQTQFEESYLMPALFARLAVFFGGLAALLVAIGLYGALAYQVNRRTMEIGVRMALGAQRRQVLLAVLRDSLLLATVGLAVGLPLAWFASKLMASMLYKLSAHDLFSLIAAGVGMVSVSIAAALIPARRAARVEPMQALRTE
ncbi:ABC transporter permease [Acidobacterium sp. S8]|uniref:ABC transporter permease n=1 Tax=Acidobacterium sp. S8 TaxID=1641854 RepID=UPI00131ECB62|nr:ABC transporter permease [Acidobacterium sp. S8]